LMNKRLRPELIDDEPKGFTKKHVYGGRAALCFEMEPDPRGVFTVYLDGAHGTGPKAYDWKNKIRVMMTMSELPQVLAVLLGFMPRCEFKNHGPKKDKGFSMEDQGDKVFVKVFCGEEGKKMKAVPMPPEDAYYVSQVVLKAMKGVYGMDGSDVISLVRGTVARMKSNAGGEQRRTR